MKIGALILAFLLLAAGYLAARALYFSEPENPFGPYTVGIHRDYQNETELELIYRTENLSCPDGSWYVGSFDRVVIADCVNSEALDYYTGVIENLSRDPDYLGFTFLSASFYYTARVSHSPATLNATTTVTLTLRFSDYCGNLCAMGFTHQRVATYSQEGELLALEGDDVEPSVWVS